MLVNSASENKNWAKKVKTLLDTYGFSYVWHDPFSIDIFNFHRVFKQRIIDVFFQSWHNSISTSPSLHSYQYFKSMICYENYLDFVPKKFRISLTQLRLSAHSLRIEAGRYGNHRLERNQRTCQVCNSNDIEDEYHFVIICPAYVTLRKRYIKPFYLLRPSVCKFVELLSSSIELDIINLSKFIYYAFSLRKQTLSIAT